MSDLSRAQHVISCTKCGAAMNHVVRIEPALREPGLVGYECPNCGYMTSVLLEPHKPEAHGG